MRLRLIEEGFPGDTAFDVAVSRALMQRVAAGELPETLRLARPGAMVAFAKQDAVAPGYEAAVRAARACGFEAVLRLAGGRAAVFHEETIALAHAVPHHDPRAGIHSRFDWTVAGGSHKGGVLVVGGADRVRDVLVPVYGELGLPWRPATAGAVEEELDGAAPAGAAGSDAPSEAWHAVRDALLAEYARDYELVTAELDEPTLALAAELAPQHRAD